MAKKNPRSSVDYFSSIKYVLLIIVLLGGIWGPYKIDLPKIRATLIDSCTPLIEVLGIPFQWLERKIFLIYDYVHLHQQFEKLRYENQQLKNRLYAFNEISAENAHLKKLSNLIELPSHRSYVAKVLGIPNDLSSQTIIIGAGTKHGINKNFAVLNEQGVIGRVIEVGEETARVLLITDYRSRIPVLVQSNREQAIVTGNNTNHPLLLYIQDSKQLKPGETLVTSGYGGVFPPGLLVGQIGIIEEGIIKVDPLSLMQLEYVKIVAFLEGKDLNSFSTTLS